MQLSVAAVPGDRRGPGGDARHDRRAAERPGLARRPVRRDPQARVARRTGCRAIDAIVDRTDPGPGRLLRRPRRPGGSRTWSAGPGFAEDPDFRRSSHRRLRRRGPAGRWPGAATPRALRRARSRCITTASTRRPATGSGSSTPATTSASGSGSTPTGEEVHPLMAKPNPPRPGRVRRPRRGDGRRRPDAPLDPRAGPRRQRPGLPGGRGLADPRRALKRAAPRPTIIRGPASDPRPHDSRRDR